MVVNDRGLAEIVNTNTTVTIANREYHIKSNPSGSCDGCYFLDKRCQRPATQYCTSNGGNIIVEAEPNTK